MPGLALPFTEFLQEIDAIRRLARKFIDRQSFEAVLPGYQSAVENLRDTPTQRVTKFEIPQRDPIRTIVSRGASEPSGKGPDVFATVSSVWEVKRVPSQPASRPSDEFVVVGQASTKVRVFQDREEGDVEIAMWRMEIGDDASPGCHFHVHACGQDDEPPFPKYLPVPRLPSLLFTPATVLEYVLGELFQDDWQKAILEGEQGVVNRWQPVQHRWLHRLLHWHLESMDEGPSPWLAIKRTKPRRDLFTASKT